MTLIVTTSPGFGKTDPVKSLIEKNDWKLIRCTDTTKPDGGLSEHIENADYLVVGLIPVTTKTLNQCKNLKAVLKNGVGTDNIDIDACTAANIPVTNTPGANADAVAELAIGMMFGLARKIPAGNASIIAGKWQRQIGTQLTGKTIGIVGFGNIGRTLALKARGIGMKVVATDPYPNLDFAKEHEIEIVELEALLAKSDYISLHLFGGEDNAALINANTLSMVKPTACLLNLARGEIVDLDAVYDALSTEKLGGVAIDAYVSEPPDITHPIFSHPRAIFMPHSGADTKEAVENVGLMVVEDIQSFISNERPNRILNKTLYKN